MNLSVAAQTDDRFWFAIPEVTEDHNDRPIQIRFNTFEQPADIIISMPANPSFQPIPISVPASSQSVFDLTPFIDQLETRPANSVLNTGLLITASTCITTYYEIDAWNNTDIYILKGSNALGTAFMTPFQTAWINDDFETPARSGFDIVATENNTRVIITPAIDALDHQGRRPFEIFLNRGQTYSTVANGSTIADRLYGSSIVSDKPIAVTLKDDSQLNRNGGTCADLGGDQLVPIEAIGTEYIVPRGRLNTSDEVFIMATENQTDIFLNGRAIPEQTINRGEQIRYRLTDDVVAIESTRPVYVLHASGTNCEVGHAIVPHLTCTGSKSISSSRADEGQYFWFIIVPRGHEGNFTVEGVNFQINPGAFFDVPGNPDYVVARISTNGIPVDAPFRVSNSTAGFHFGTLNGNTGSRYGYFSDFGSLRVSTSDPIICQGEFVDIAIKSTYSILDWTPDVGMNELEFSLSPMATTEYRLIASDDELCRDTADFTIVVRNAYEAFDTIVACVNDPISLGNQTINESGDYQLNFLTTEGCDSIFFYHINFIETLSSFETLTLCPGELILLNDGTELDQAGIYIQRLVSQNGCDSIHHIEVISDNTLYNRDTAFLCTGSSLVIFGTTVTEPGLYSQMIPSSRSCDSLQETLVLPAEPYDLVDTVYLCRGDQINLLDQTINVAGEYMGLFNSVEGCDSMQTYVVIDDDPSTYLNWPESAVIQFGDSIQWPFTSQLDWIDSIRWNTLLGVACDQCENWTLFPLATTTYTVQVFTRGGCAFEHTFTIEVEEKKPMFFPNVFSPNGDGINDLFNAFTPEAGAIIDVLDIYDRWGNLISRRENLLPNDDTMGWDGYNNTKKANPGVYVYHAEVSFVEGITLTYSGDVTLIR